MRRTLSQIAKGVTPAGRSSHGGRVRGPGTGTSDSIDAKLSHGEFVLPTDTVRKVGVKRLQDLVDMTHTPSGKPQHPARFVDGGPVDDENKRPNSFGDAAAAARNPGVTQAGAAPAQPPLGQTWETTDTLKAGALAAGGAAYAGGKALAPVAPGLGYTGPGRMAADIAKNAVTSAAKASVPGIPKTVVGGFAPALALGTTAVDTATTPTEDYRKRFGLETNDPSLLGDIGVRAIGAASDLGNNLTLGLAGKMFRDKQEAAAPQPVNAAAPTTPNPADQRLAAGTQTAPVGLAAAAASPAATPASPAATALQTMPGVYQHGRGQFSDSAEGMGFKPAFTGQPSAQNLNAGGNLAASQEQGARARLMAAGMGPGSGPVAPGSFTGGYSGVIGSADTRGNMLGRSPEQQRRDAEVSASSIHKPTAERGRAALTRMNSQDLQQERNAGDLAVMLAQQQGQSARERLIQAGQLQRTGIESQRYDEANQIARGRLTLEQIAAGHQSRTSERVERAQVELENAKTPEAQRSARARLMALTGKTDDDVWAHAPGGQMVDQKTQQLITVPSTIYNRRSGETRAEGAQGAGAAMPSSRDAMVKGQVYQTAHGLARWDGSQFQPVR